MADTFISKNHSLFSFDAKLPPVCEIDSGAILEIEDKDRTY
ncbi:MAG: hypothetical protein AB1489_22825 [Acidobacteriota bacterium]